MSRQVKTIDQYLYSKFTLAVAIELDCTFAFLARYLHTGFNPKLKVLGQFGVVRVVRGNLSGPFLASQGPVLVAIEQKHASFDGEKIDETE